MGVLVGRIVVFRVCFWAPILGKCPKVSSKRFWESFVGFIMIYRGCVLRISIHREFGEADRMGKWDWGFEIIFGAFEV